MEPGWLGLGPDSDLSVSSVTLTRDISSLSCRDRDQLLFTVKREMVESKKGQSDFYIFTWQPFVPRGRLEYLTEGSS